MAQVKRFSATLRIPEESPAHGCWLRHYEDGPWHAVSSFEVKVLTYLPNGYDCRLYAHILCTGTPTRLDAIAPLRNDRPTVGRCEACDAAIEAI